MSLPTDRYLTDSARRTFSLPSRQLLLGFLHTQHGTRKSSRKHIHLPDKQRKPRCRSPTWIHHRQVRLILYSFRSLSFSLFWSWSHRVATVCHSKLLRVEAGVLSSDRPRRLGEKDEKKKKKAKSQVGRRRQYRPIGEQAEKTRWLARSLVVSFFGENFSPFSIISASLALSLSEGHKKAFLQNASLSSFCTMEALRLVKGRCHAGSPRHFGLTIVRHLSATWQTRGRDMTLLRRHWKYSVVCTTLEEVVMRRWDSEGGFSTLFFSFSFSFLAPYFWFLS